jgi:hypothetical protein
MQWISECVLKINGHQGRAIFRGCSRMLQGRCQTCCEMRRGGGCRLKSPCRHEAFEQRYISRGYSLHGCLCLSVKTKHETNARNYTCTSSCGLHSTSLMYFSSKPIKPTVSSACSFTMLSTVLPDTEVRFRTREAVQYGINRWYASTSATMSYNWCCRYLQPVHRNHQYCGISTHGRILRS